jgi:hypothetical protein
MQMWRASEKLEVPQSALTPAFVDLWPSRYIPQLKQVSSVVSVSRTKSDPSAFIS